VQYWIDYGFFGLGLMVALLSMCFYYSELPFLLLVGFVGLLGCGIALHCFSVDVTNVYYWMFIVLMLRGSKGATIIQCDPTLMWIIGGFIIILAVCFVMGQLVYDMSLMVAH
jgi:hypothetical protein